MNDFNYKSPSQNDVDSNKTQLEIKHIYKQKTLSPVGFRGEILTMGRSNTNQTGTIRKWLFPQNNCQDIVLVYSNWYGGASNNDFVKNTNSITVKASLEHNGVIYPVYFNGKRSVVIDGGGVVKSDAVGIYVTPSDTFQVRTYFDAGSGGYIPTQHSNGKIFSELTGEITNIDGVVYGSDLVDSGTVTDDTLESVYSPSFVLGSTTSDKSVLIVGDSIVTGGGDTTFNQSIGYMARYCLDNKIGYSKISLPGTDTGRFVDSMYLRGEFMKNHTHCIVAYGTNDVFTALAIVKARLLKIWEYCNEQGMIVFATTLPPKTTTTDNFITNANQTITAQEARRLEINDWLRDNSSNGAISQSNGNLSTVFDIASTVEINGKWITYESPIHAGAVTSASSTYIFCDTLPFVKTYLDVSHVVKITSGTGVGQLRYVSNNDTALKINLTSAWTTIPDNTSTFEIYKVLTMDGVHPSKEGHKLMKSAIKL